MRMTSRVLLTLGLFWTNAVVVVAQSDRAHQLATQAANQIAEVCGDVVTVADCHDAHPTGCTRAQTARYDAYLNFLKNQRPGRGLVPDGRLSPNDFVMLEDHIPTGLGRFNHKDVATTLPA